MGNKKSMFIVKHKIYRFTSSILQWSSFDTGVKKQTLRRIRAQHDTNRKIHVSEGNKFEGENAYFISQALDIQLRDITTILRHFCELGINMMNWQPAEFSLKLVMQD